MPTTSLFAALDVASGFVIGKCYKRHRAAEFLDFLKQIDAQRGGPGCLHRFPRRLSGLLPGWSFAISRAGHD
jgi:hypothetical protein